MCGVSTLSFVIPLFSDTIYSVEHKQINKQRRNEMVGVRRFEMLFSRILTVVVALIFSASAQAELAYEYEDFNSFQNVYQTTWIVGTFNGTADIQSVSGNLGVFSGPYDLNLNGNPYLIGALANNGSNESTYINFYEGYEWSSFAGIFSAAWDVGQNAQVRFTFNNTNTSESTTVWTDLTGNYDALVALDFDLEHSFNQIEIYGDFVVMDDLMVTIPSPSVLAMVGIAGISLRRRKRTS
jgi:hypothetical protein